MLSKDGTMLYIADAVGFVRAYEVADIEGIIQTTTTTDAPTSAATAESTEDPSTVVPDSIPVVTPGPSVAANTDVTIIPTEEQSTMMPTTDYPLIRTIEPNNSTTGDAASTEISGSTQALSLNGIFYYFLIPIYFMAVFL